MPGFYRFPKPFYLIEKPFSLTEKGFSLSGQPFSLVEKGFSLAEQGFSVIEKGFSMTDKPFFLVEKGVSLLEQGFSTVEKGCSLTEKGCSLIEKGCSMGLKCRKPSKMRIFLSHRFNCLLHHALFINQPGVGHLRPASAHERSHFGSFRRKPERSKRVAARKSVLILDNQRWWKCV